MKSRSIYIIELRSGAERRAIMKMKKKTVLQSVVVEYQR